jgi:hypothetical protein
MNQPKNNHRKYLRLNTVFPVEFNTVDADKKPTSSIVQGFTRNIGRGGMCVEVKLEKGKQPFGIIPNKTTLRLIINIPTSDFATESYATVKWFKKVSEYIFDTYIFGVEYCQIDTDSQKMIERHVLWLHRKPKVALVFFLTILLLLIVLTYFTLHAK